MNLDHLRVKIFADGADRESILELAKNPLVKGFTTNPTLMRAAGVTDYERFARDLLEHIGDRPVSFEVFSEVDMSRQAFQIASWGDNVYVKIPVTYTNGESTATLVRYLSEQGVRLNVTAILTLPQVATMAYALEECPHAFVSVFAGRVADTGRDPVPLMKRALTVLKAHPNCELLWASTREVFNVVQADKIGCDVITVTPDQLRKLDGLGRDLDAYSLETVRMFHDDAAAAGYVL